jgi:hypothetical protein
VNILATRIGFSARIQDARSQSSARLANINIGSFAPRSVAAQCRISDTRASTAPRRKPHRKRGEMRNARAQHHGRAGGAGDPFGH